MAELLLILSLTALAFAGYWVVGKIGSFIDDHVVKYDGEGEEVEQREQPGEDRNATKTHFGLPVLFNFQRKGDSRGRQNSGRLSGKVNCAFCRNAHLFHDVG